MDYSSVIKLGSLLLGDVSLNKIIILLIVFLLGWLSSTVWGSYFDNYGVGGVKESGIVEGLVSDQAGGNIDINSPYDWIKSKQISVYDDRVIIKIDNPEWSIFTNTKSMDPVIDSTSNAIEIIPQKESDIHLGDIAAYQSKYKKGIVTHRIVDIGYDVFGWYAKLKGDNNNYSDPGKVRFEQIKRIVVGIIY